MVIVRSCVSQELRNYRRTSIGVDLEKNVGIFNPRRAGGGVFEHPPPPCSFSQVFCTPVRASFPHM